jgi:hypothetical protein
MLAASRSPAQTPARSSQTASRLVVTPRDITLAASQAQRFAVTDANGKPVAVHWDLSGINCSGSSCGTIDEDGTYTAPHGLSSSQVVVLEGVLVSDPRHSVLTRIQLTPAAAKVQNPSLVQIHAKSLQIDAPKATPEIAKPVASSANPTYASSVVPAQSAQAHSQSPPVNTAINAPLIPLSNDDDDDVVATAVVGADPASPSLKPTALKPPEPPAPVTYRNGQLTIDVNNVTLSAVLGLVAEKSATAAGVSGCSGSSSRH